MQALAAAAVSWPAFAASVAAALLVAAVVMRLCSEAVRTGKRTSEGDGGAEARLPAGTLGWPLIGETLAFISAASSARPESFVEKRCLRYGKVFRSHLWGSPMVVSADPEVSRAVLQGDTSTFVPWYPRSLMELMGESSILVLNGVLQRRVHGLAGAFLKSAELKARVTADMQIHVAAAMDAWRAGAGAGVVRVQDVAKSIVFGILIRTLIGLEDGPEMNYVRQQFCIFIDGLISLPIKLPGTQLYRSLQAKKRMTRLIQKIIQEKRSRRAAAAVGGEGFRGAPRDLIDVLMSNGSDELTNELISDNMIDLMIPAEDSVPVLITLAVKYLSDCPLALQQLEEENMELKKKSDAGETPLQWTDYMSLTFTQHVITGDAADWQHHQWDHEEGGEGRGGEGVRRTGHPQGLVRPCLLPLRPPRRRRLRRPLRLQPMEVEGEGHHGQQQLHSFRRRAEALPRGGHGQAPSLHLSAPPSHQFQVGGRGG
ncbi:hypothetical protein GUJ93_ZPchr0010g10008 [Zizania palustris]|uniref:Cytochrome P450 n=1 Tax=Zizania palustris TaxID=103762 RepID=A0A8J6BGH3_ZIZPA|nr:hypothetical protein GUJ93_ZPchr0010g10008 [Zizania palustris]